MAPYPSEELEFGAKPERTSPCRFLHKEVNSMCQSVQNTRNRSDVTRITVTVKPPSTCSVRTESYKKRVVQENLKAEVSPLFLVFTRSNYLPAYKLKTSSVEGGTETHKITHFINTNLLQVHISHNTQYSNTAQYKACLYI